MASPVISSYGSTPAVCEEEISQTNNSLLQDYPESKSLKKLGGGALLISALLLGVALFNSSTSNDTSVRLNSLNSIPNFKFSSLSETETRQIFNDFQTKHKVKYSTSEEKELRFSHFKYNLRRIDLLNEGSQYQYGITKFADYSEDELKAIRGYKATEDKLSFDAAEAEIDAEINMDTAYDTYNEHLMGYQTYSEEMCGACHRYPEMASLELDTLPESFDWRDYGAVSEMRNQYICGDCWSFATTDVIASQQYLYGDDLDSLSAQQLTACDNYCWGCDGGWFVGAFRYIFEENLRTDLEYPFMSMNGATQECRLDILANTDSSTHIQGWTRVMDMEDIEGGMKLALMKNGPMAVAIDANSMLYYTGGVDMGTSCTVTELDHAVLLVGWGVEDEIEYWLVKNSWGLDWGESGYWKVAFGKNACGITEYVMATF